MTDNQVVLTKSTYESLKPFINDATVYINKDEVRMSLDDYLIVTNTRDEAEREAMLSFSFA